MQCPTHHGRWLFLIGATIFIVRLAYASASAINDPKCALTIREGDIAYKNFANATALASYRRAVAIDSSNYEALWKLARACRYRHEPAEKPAIAILCIRRKAGTAMYDLAPG